MKTYKEMTDRIKQLYIEQDLNNKNNKLLNIEIAKISFEMMSISSIVNLCRTGK